MGNLDEIVERERARLAGEQLPAVPGVRPALPEQKPGLIQMIQNIINPPAVSSSNCEPGARL